MRVRRRWKEYCALALVLLLALGLRLHNIGFGLPSLYDPDEPLFVIKAAELLTDRTLNPHWFGHPGSTTIYLTSLTAAGVVAVGYLAGSWSSIAEFTQAAYADPALIFVPARVMMAWLGLASVWLTYVVARRVHGAAIALIAAILLSINSLHLAWSQVIRTDIHASVFMLATLYFSIRIFEQGKWRDYLIAGVLTGFGVATKWPAASIFVAVVGAALSRICARSEPRRAIAVNLLTAGLASVAALIFASPFLVLDWSTVVSDLTGETRPIHLGHTGGGLASNLHAYLRYQVAGTMGSIGLAMAALGSTLSAWRWRAAKWTLIPAAIAFLLIISSQHLIWSRWILPVMPMICIFAAIGIVASAEMLSKALLPGWRPATRLAITILALVPSAIGTVAQMRERQNDTRARAAAWAIRHIPADRSIVLEHLELGLRDQPWTILFPIGEAGCVDGRRMLRSGVRYDDVNKLRKGSPIVDLGNVSPARLDSCRADYAILTYYDLYRRETASFPVQNATYSSLLTGGRTMALFKPVEGHSGGPIVRVVALKEH